jgi:hypothetical protein
MVCDEVGRGDQHQSPFAIYVKKGNQRTLFHDTLITSLCLINKIHICKKPFAITNDTVIPG